MEKRYRIVPRGIGLVIGCNTFPTWNGYPGLFASLATGNAVVVKPHPAAILPLAISVQIAREVLAEAGFDPNVVTLVAHDAGGRHGADARAAAGGQAHRLHRQQRQRRLARSATPGRRRCTRRRRASTRSSSTQRADFKGVARNIAFSLSLYTGQMCTAPQNIYVPRGGIDTAEGHLAFDQVAQALGEAVQKLLADPARAVEILGAVVNEGVVRRLEAARTLGTIVRRHAGRRRTRNSSRRASARR